LAHPEIFALGGVTGFGGSILGAQHLSDLPPTPHTRIATLKPTKFA